MIRQPKLVLRESALDDLIESWPTGTFLETGAGTGYMTRKFLDKGYTGACFELSDSAKVKLHSNLKPYSNRIELVDILEDLKDNEFDYLFSFEVLEHIENDLEALRKWSCYLKPGGRILISVPAHQRKYGNSDDIVGHVRRYERPEVFHLLQKAGYEEIEIINYGFPVTELTRVISNILVKDDQANKKLSLQQKSLASSHSRQTRIRNIIEIVGEKPILPFRWIQRIFYKYDLGDGIIATAKKLRV